MKPWLLKLHRWVALVFALPLVFVIGTGLVLSFEPWIVVRAIQPGSLTVAKVQALLDRHDPSGQARSLNFRSYDNTLTISAGRRGGKVVDAATGEVKPSSSALAGTLLSMRRLHEHLIFDLGWLVSVSSIAMLVLAAFGVLMGWPRFANSLAGWHKGMSWGLLPLIVLSPLTGLFLAWGITFTGPPQGGGGGRGAPLPLKEAVRIVGEKHDLSSLVWLRQMGGRQLVRLVDGGEFRVYVVTRNGTIATARNWPRLWHEGNFAGVWSALMNVVISFAMVGLLVTGVWIWLRRQFRRRSRVRRPRVAEA